MKFNGFSWCVLTRSLQYLLQMENDIFFTPHLITNFRQCFKTIFKQFLDSGNIQTFSNKNNQFESNSSYMFSGGTNSCIKPLYLYTTIITFIRWKISDNMRGNYLSYVESYYDYILKEYRRKNKSVK